MKRYRITYKVGSNTESAYREAESLPDALHSFLDNGLVWSDILTVTFSGRSK